MYRWMFALAAASGLVGVAHAAPGDGDDMVGVGVLLGDPTALNGKVYFTEQSAVGIALAYADQPVGPWHSYAHAVYLLHPSVLAAGEDLELTWHVGAGPVAVSDEPDAWPAWDSDGFGLGVRVPIGLDLNVQEVPLQFSLEVAANTFLFPQLGLDIGPAVAGRFFF